MDLAGAYHQRWEEESAFDEIKTDLRGRGEILRSKTPTWSNNNSGACCWPTTPSARYYCRPPIRPATTRT
jgi:hypothetical protein